MVFSELFDDWKLCLNKIYLTYFNFLFNSENEFFGLWKFISLPRKIVKEKTKKNPALD